MQFPWLKAASREMGTGSRNDQFLKPELSSGLETVLSAKDLFGRLSEFGP